MNCFPFEDPCVVITVTGQALLEALENGVSTYPALEGRFPQVSNIVFTFDPQKSPGKRIPNPTKEVLIRGQPLVLDKEYKLVTRDYMARGKDGFDSLLKESEGGKCKEIVSDEDGILLSMLLRQYFMSLKTMGQWSKWGRSMERHWQGVHQKLHKSQPVVEPSPTSPVARNTFPDPALQKQGALKRSYTTKDKEEAKYVDDSDDEEETAEAGDEDVAEHERKLRIMRQVMNKWRRLAGISLPKSCDSIGEGEFAAAVAWTRGVAPRVEGRINIIGVAA